MLNTNFISCIGRQSVSSTKGAPRPTKIGEVSDGKLKLFKKQPGVKDGSR
jgi:hypothetical protein